MEVRIRGRPLLPIAAFVGALLASPGSASAQIVYSGYTNGCFGAGCVLANTSAAQFAVLTMPNSQLTFANSTFSGVGTSTGYIQMATPAIAGAIQQQLNNLGVFYLTMGGTAADTYSDVFKLAVRFVDPGSGVGVFTAVLSGTVRVGMSAPNRVEITFDDPQQVINWSNHVTGEVGTIDLSLSEQRIVLAGQLNQTTQSLRVGGEGIVTVAPEPISMILVGSGLFGVAGVARRRRRYLESSATEA